ncbi:MAG TPA: aminotransferase class I/II-fold pyridoxal phosphate-dependent enzyme [Jatrophihabitans sp.]|jgi:bifunctional pyridoxal-dependent enzyme with beta-cystathionase and maltose regulon repressor activities|uniref:MalY/PatB family protein n=1 Tax=Jatrophihabitans sp. TaxID=1932789 RepID=UPI002DFC20B6|nr:aminotransferase class I/II-fold pyridoxal phosphate-dependent enzyme [Jatrophihabitans sp.]
MSGAFDPSLEWLRAKRGVKWARPSAAVLPAWVADMDFPLARPIRAAIEAALDRGDLGYPDWPVDPLAEPFTARMAQRYGWSPDPAHVRSLTDLIQAVQLVLHLGTEPGDGVVVHTPNYPPFLATIASMGRTTIPAPLVVDDGTWTWDHAALDRAAARARVLLLVNPQNPTGRSFTADELGRLAELAERHDLVVISDEIHADLTHDPRRHVPFASLGAEVAARTVTVSSATKAFNIAGLRTALAHVGPAELRRRWDAQPPDLFGGVNVLGVEATLAAWRDGGSWLDALRAQLRTNRDRVAAWAAGHDGVSWLPPEAGYLAWLDIPEIAGDPAARFRAAGVELSPGPDFGPGNETRARLNFATSSAVLDTILERLDGALG